MTETRRIAVLVSAGRHPATQRPRQSVLDAKALETGLMLTEIKKGMELDVIHAGSADEESLVDYLGMGIEKITVIPVSNGKDVAPFLGEYLHNVRPDIILTGDANEDGFGSGQLPFAIGQALDIPVLSNICDVTLEDGHCLAKQAIESGGRRKFRVTIPCILTIGHGAGAPRQPSFAKGRRGRRVIAPVNAGDANPHQGFTLQKARPKRKHIAKIDPNASAADRLKAISSLQQKNGEVVQGLSPDDIAVRIVEILRIQGLGPQTEEGTDTQ